MYEITKLSVLFKLYSLKVESKWTEKSFPSLFNLLKEMFPENNELPCSTYEAKKILCPMGMDALKNHACHNDCVTFRNEYANSTHCPKCGASRYK